MCFGLELNRIAQRSQVMNFDLMHYHVAKLRPQGVIVKFSELSWPRLLIQASFAVVFQILVDMAMDLRSDLPQSNQVSHWELVSLLPGDSWE